MSDGRYERWRALHPTGINAGLSFEPVEDGWAVVTIDGIRKAPDPLSALRAAIGGEA